MFRDMEHDKDQSDTQVFPAARRLPGAMAYREKSKGRCETASFKHFD